MDSPDDSEENVGGGAGHPGETPPETGDDSVGPPGDSTPETAANGEGVPEREEWRSEAERDAPAPEGDTSQPTEAQLFVYDLVSSVLAVAIVGAYLFAVSGVWPPLVAVESESMVPNMEVNDLVFVMEEERFAPEEAHGDTGVVAAQEADGYRQFGGSGDVIVFAPNGNDRRTPIIHRAMFYVEEGENWYDRADERYVGGATSCNGTNEPGEPGLANCPAPHAGFITKGDNNGLYDQAGPGGASTGPVKPAWIIGTAEFRIPGLGWVRLATQ
jgi:signal peptidase